VTVTLTSNEDFDGDGLLDVRVCISLGNSSDEFQLNSTVMDLQRPYPSDLNVTNFVAANWPDPLLPSTPNWIEFADDICSGGPFMEYGDVCKYKAQSYYDGVAVAFGRSNNVCFVLSSSQEDVDPDIVEESSILVSVFAGEPYCAVSGTTC